MKTSPKTKTHTPTQSIKLLALAGTIVSLLGAPTTSWSSPTLIYDSYVPTPFVPGVRHGADTALIVNSSNTGFFKFILTKSLPTGITGGDINKATMKIFIS